uniref:Uncharacterized protein n=1 Tax=Fagus sylvatica TaxID=28930 RepID=A0A2N9EIP6_FAGSY
MQQMKHKKRTQKSSEQKRQIVTEDTRQKRRIVTEDTTPDGRDNCHGRHQTRLSRKTPDGRDDCHGRHQTEEMIVTKDNSRQIQIEIVTRFTKKIHLHNKKQIVQQQGSSWAIGQCIKFRFQSDSGDGDVTGRGSRSGSGLGLIPDGEGAWRHVDLETDRRRKRHQRVKARVIISGGDIFTGDSSLPDESIDGWIKANGAAKRRRRREECATLPETNRARGGACKAF